MRFKDFGDVSATVLSKDLVTVSSTVPTDSEVIKRLELKNRDYLRPWRVPLDMDTSSAKIFTVRYGIHIVGQIILFNFQLNQGLRSCSISYWVAEDYANKNIATTSVELVATHAFTRLGVHEIDAVIQPENAPSIRVIQKLKYAHRDMIGEGRMIDGRWQNFTLYTITRDLKDANV